MKIWLFLLSISIVSFQNLQSQNVSDRKYILNETNEERLNELSKTYLRNQEIYSNLLKGNAIDSIVTFKNGSIGYFSGRIKDGSPIYHHDENLEAAITSHVDEIWVGGSSGLDLDGSGIQIGLWEAGGTALTSHQEFNGRVSIDGFSNTTSHATRMAGTILGAGINNSARGMASASTLISRNSNNDEAELANFAAQGGILSNHSYGIGNPEENIERYGHYSYLSAEWDDILYNAPFLTTFKSAGNSRNDGFNTDDGGYDILYTLAVAKNLITIGAVYYVPEYTGPESIEQSVFSSWGPTDDWRIKPDIVANGVNVFSADYESDTSYDSGNGTSQACAVVTGSVALLQQHYYNLHEKYMKSATVKALLLSTADEAGQHDGPDFQNGWGLVNVSKAADVISNQGSTSQISELTLKQFESNTITLETDGTTPLSVMIAWTDPTGNVNSLQHDDLTTILVNDLDIRLTNQDQTYLPWTMTPTDNFAEAARKGDNFRDNVECIQVNDIPAGSYTLTVSNKGNLYNDTQDYSLVVNGIVEFTTGTNSIDESNQLVSIFPNPSQDGFFTLSIPEITSRTPYHIEVHNMEGGLVHIEDFTENEHLLNLSKLNSGVYNLSITSDNMKSTKVIQIVR